MALRVWKVQLVTVHAYGLRVKKTGFNVTIVTNQLCSLELDTKGPVPSSIMDSSWVFFNT